MKNKIEDVRNHLFAALERLNDDEAMKENANIEIKKATAIANLAHVIVHSAKVEVDFMKQSKRLTESGFITPVDAPLKIEEEKPVKKIESIFDRY